MFITIARDQSARAMMQGAHGQAHICDPDQSIIVLRLMPDFGDWADILVVEKSVLLSDAYLSPNAIETPVSISWLDWSQRARIFQNLPKFCVHGTRLFVPGIMQSLTLYICDFNHRRRPVQLDRDDMAAPDRSITTVVKEGNIQSRIFAYPARTSLPYHVVGANPPPEWINTRMNPVMNPVMNENYLIIVRNFTTEHPVSSLHLSPSLTAGLY